MNKAKLESLLIPYNPWWQPDTAWKMGLPDFQRPIVSEVLADLTDLPQLISITGPRRVGKSTAVKHVITRLIEERKIDPGRILYFSFDDPELFVEEGSRHAVFDQLVKRMLPQGPPLYCFFDEIQRLPRWELYLKKAYDLQQPVRFVVSGSASTPIFRKSQETLLGRVKDRHLLPFSFREFCEYRLRGQEGFSQALASGGGLKPMLLLGDGPGVVKQVSELTRALQSYDRQISEAVLAYCRDGGFPEVWSLPDHIRKIEYIMEQQVRKVLYEDLMMLTQYRKPENVLRFFVYLLAHPGIEINTAKISQEIDVERRIVDENLPRLELTDLIMRIQRFSAEPRRARKGNIKCYPVDLALRNAVLKTWSLPDAQQLGYYAENLVLRELITWPERIEISYYREKEHEVDFIFTHGGNEHLPIEVKTRKYPHATLRHFCQRHDARLGVVITTERGAKFDEFLHLPLRYFLLAASGGSS